MTSDKVAQLANAFAAKQNKKFSNQYKAESNKELTELKAQVSELSTKVEFLEKALFSLIEILEQPK